MTKQVQIGSLLKRVPKPVLDEIVRGGVIPFIGAGFSKNCDGPEGFEPPNWKELGKAVANDLRDFAYDGSPIEAISVYEERYKRASLIELLMRACRVSEIYPGEAHRLLCRCFPKLICTTNFDSLIENASIGEKLSPTVVTSEKSLSVFYDGQVIVKIHGDFNSPESMVLTEGDYDLFLTRRPLMCTYLSSLFITRTMMLIGYSLDDSDLRQLLKVVQARLGDMARPVYCIAVGATDDEIVKFKRRGVEVINLPKSREGGYRGVIAMFLRQLEEYIRKTSPEYITSNEEESRVELQLSELGNSLCYLSSSANRTAYFKKLMDPLVRNAGGVPLWSDNIVVLGKMPTISAVEVAIRKSRVRIFDVTDLNPTLETEIAASLREGVEKTLIIYEDKGYAEALPPWLRVCRSFSYQANDCECDRCEDNYTDYRLNEAIAELLSKKSVSLLEDARRLLKNGEFDSAIVSAWAEVENTFRSRKDALASRMLIERIAKECDLTSKEHTELMEFRYLRNRVVHGQGSANKTEAEFSIRMATRILKRHMQ